jgi:integrase
VNKLRSKDAVKRRFKLHLFRLFGRNRRASTIRTSDVRKYVTKRLDEGASNATVNRELAALNRAFTLGVSEGKLLSKPYVPRLKEDYVRSGFFESEQFKNIRRNLSEELSAVVTFLYITGWRLREVLRLEWRQIDLTAGRVLLDPGSSKNSEGRVFPFTEELRELLVSQRQITDQQQMRSGRVIPWAFHRQGQSIKDFHAAWRTACKKAGVPGRIIHDLRRTAVRNLVRAGVPERVAMQMTGHKTRSVFERYNIVSESDLNRAAELLDAVGAQ